VFVGLREKSFGGFTISGIPAGRADQLERQEQIEVKLRQESKRIGS